MTEVQIVQNNHLGQVDVSVLPIEQEYSGTLSTTTVVRPGAAASASLQLPERISPSALTPLLHQRIQGSSCPLLGPEASVCDSEVAPGLLRTTYGARTQYKRLICTCSNREAVVNATATIGNFLLSSADVAGALWQSSQSFVRTANSANSTESARAVDNGDLLRRVTGKQQQQRGGIVTCSRINLLTVLIIAAGNALSYTLPQVRGKSSIHVMLRCAAGHCMMALPAGSSSNSGSGGSAPGIVKAASDVQRATRASAASSSTRP